MGIMLVYDTTNAKSFENITKWLTRIDEVSRFAYVILLIALRVLSVFSTPLQKW